MKRYILAFLLPILIGCTNTYKPIRVKAIWQCESNTVVISAHGDYRKAKAAKYELYRDANKNKVLDEIDQMIGYTVNMSLVHDDYHLSQPIKLSDDYLETSLFVRVISGSDTAISEIPRCSASVSDFTKY